MNPGMIHQFFSTVAEVRAAVGETVGRIPHWAEIVQYATRICAPLQRFAQATLRKFPGLRKLEWLLEIESLTRRHPVVLALSMLFVIWRGLKTTSLGHIGTDSTIYPFLALISGYNPFLGLVCGGLFGVADLVQKFFVPDIYGARGWGDINYWGAMFGYIIAYSSTMWMGMAPGIMARVCRRLARYAWDKVRGRADATADGATPAHDAIGFGVELLGSVMGGAATSFISEHSLAPHLEKAAFMTRVQKDFSCHRLETRILQNAAPFTGFTGGGGSSIPVLTEATSPVTGGGQPPPPPQTTSTAPAVPVANEPPGTTPDVDLPLDDLSPTDSDTPGGNSQLTAVPSDDLPPGQPPSKDSLSASGSASLASGSLDSGSPSLDSQGSGSSSLDSQSSDSPSSGSPSSGSPSSGSPSSDSPSSISPSSGSPSDSSDSSTSSGSSGSTSPSGGSSSGSCSSGSQDSATAGSSGASGMVLGIGQSASPASDSNSGSASESSRQRRLEATNLDVVMKVLGPAEGPNGEKGWAEVHFTIQFDFTNETEDEVQVSGRASFGTSWGAKTLQSNATSYNATTSDNLRLGDPISFRFCVQPAHNHDLPESCWEWSGKVGDTPSKLKKLMLKIVTVAETTVETGVYSPIGTLVSKDFVVSAEWINETEEDATIQCRYFTSGTWLEVTRTTVSQTRNQMPFPITIDRLQVGESVRFRVCIWSSSHPAHCLDAVAAGRAPGSSASPLPSPGPSPGPSPSPVPPPSPSPSDSPSPSPVPPPSPSPSPSPLPSPVPPPPPSPSPGPSPSPVPPPSPSPSDSPSPSPSPSDSSSSSPNRKRWNISSVGGWTVGFIVVGGVIGFRLTDRDTGEWRKLRFKGIGVGGAIKKEGTKVKIDSLLGGAVSLSILSASGDFETPGYITFDDFNGPALVGSLGGALGGGYTLAVLNFTMRKTDPNWIWFSSPDLGSFGLGGSIILGKCDVLMPINP
jgi:hypothetical protein